MIGVFDSGVGGLSILQALRRALPTADFVYFGDTANAPYGERSAEDIRLLTLHGVSTLMSFEPDAIVIACNTATSQAINFVREKYPGMPIIGVVPVLKTVADHTKTSSVALLATRRTIDSDVTKQLKQKFLPHVSVLELALPAWVEAVEKGELDSAALRESVQDVAENVHATNADVVVLGCTHFPFLRLLLMQALPGVEILDSAGAVARQTVRVLSENQTLPDTKVAGSVVYLCSGDPEQFSRVASGLLGESVVATRA